MAPFQELPGELWGDGVTLEEVGQESLAEQLHHRFAVPGLEGVKRPSSGKAPSLRSR